MSLTWDQVAAWRVARHSLGRRADRRQVVDIVQQIGGVHAQLMSAAELALGARVRGLSPADVQTALWNDRTLVKTWAMRGTLHLIAASDFPLYVGALSTLRHFERPSWLKYHGVSLDELEAIMESVQTTLGSSGMTRERLAEAIAERTGKPKLAELLLSGWGALLKPAAFQGYLCYGPNEGQNVTFVSPEKWLGDWTPIEPEEALKEIARRFLTAYGPATIDDFSRWLGLPPGQAKRVFRSLGDELEEVVVEGWVAWTSVAALKQIRLLGPAPGVRLLPYFDPYVVAAYRHSEHLVPEEHKAQIYRPQGWIYPVVLVNGRFAGVWESEERGSGMHFKVDMFSQPSPQVRRDIESEVARLGAFLNMEVAFEFAPGSP